jgi:preprotein translocase subunit SecE
MKMKQIVTYFKDSYGELFGRERKVSWPSLADLQKSTVVVIIASAIFALLVLVMDLLSKSIMKTIYNLIA